MHIKAQCKKCDYEGYMKIFIKPFKTEHITQANITDQRLPKYGFHYGSECPQCLTWQKWKKQTDEITEQKFYAV